ILLESNDTISDIYYKIGISLNVESFYCWSPNVTVPLSHRFQYGDEDVQLKANPFKRDVVLDKYFLAYGNLKIIDMSKHILRNIIPLNDRILSMITRKNLETMSVGYMDKSTNVSAENIITVRYLPDEIRMEQPYYDINNAQCMNNLIRDEVLPVSGKMSEGEKNVAIDYSQMEECTIYIYNEIKTSRSKDQLNNQSKDDELKFNDKENELGSDENDEVASNDNDEELLLNDDKLVSNDDDKLVSNDREQVEYNDDEGEEINVKMNRVMNKPYINLDTIFQLMSMDGDYIFAKIRRGDRSISKISKKVQKYKSQVTKEMLSEWANIEDHSRGLIYKKLKSSGGLVTYRIYDTGLIEIIMNWNEDSKLEDQKGEIEREIKTLNTFIKRINELDYQLIGYENERLGYGDANFMKNPMSNTKFLKINCKTIIETGKKQISWNAFNYLCGSLKNYFNPIYFWRVYNFNEIRRLTSGINESNIYYLRTDNNMAPDPLTNIIYALGLVGGIDKEQTVSVDRQKDLIIEFKDLIYENDVIEKSAQYKSNQSGQSNSDQSSLEQYGDITLDREILEERIREIKEGNSGILINIRLLGDKYQLSIKDVNNMMEINEINYLMERLFKFYFHIGKVYKYLRNYSCPTLGWILKNGEKIDMEKLKENNQKPSKLSFKNKKDKMTMDKEKLDEIDIFNIGDDLNENEIVIPDNPDQSPSNNGDSGSEMVGEVMIPLDLRDMAEIEETAGENKKAKNALDYLKDVSKIFQTEYRRTGCTKNHPVVISIKDFWKNYTRLTKRFMELKSKLSERDQEEYKDKFRKELESGDQNLDLYIKRIVWVAKRLDEEPKKGINDRMLATEISEIIDRYNKGAQLKVPLDKEMTKYSPEYFYFCP
ncbi:MAG: hypothetical protein WD512_14475, partial [Candidatus Paceibacterota bacterium]